ncbi:hypothetical protein HDE_11405 [Halotydeus destructor]|nr:hypothetical protein HDE_11405 [Halotydeus destructor]
MEDDDLLKLRQAALMSMKKKSSPTSPTMKNHRYNMSNTSPYRMRFINNNGYNAHPRPGSKFVKNYNQRSNLIVLQTCEARESPRPICEISRPAMSLNAMANSKPREKRKSLPGRFARLDDDSSDSDADDRLDESDSEHESSTQSPNVSLVDESSLNAFDNDSASDRNVARGNDHITNYNDDSLLNELDESNKKSESGAKAKVDCESNNFDLSDHIDSTQPEELKVGEPFVLNQSKDDDAAKYEPVKSDGKPTSEECEKESKIKLKLSSSGSSEDALAKRRMKFGPVSERRGQRDERRRSPRIKNGSGRDSGRTGQRVKRSSSRDHHGNDTKKSDRSESLSSSEPKRLRSLVVLKAAH